MQGDNSDLGILQYFFYYPQNNWPVPPTLNKNDSIPSDRPLHDKESPLTGLREDEFGLYILEDEFGLHILSKKYVFKNEDFWYNRKPKYAIGDRVLTHVLPGPGHPKGAFLSGIIDEQFGPVDMYDTAIPQETVDFPVVQHFYGIKVGIGGYVRQFECRILPNPLLLKA